MENLKELLAPKTLHRLSYVAVIFWILSGVILFGIFADMENSESRFDFRCGGAKANEIDLVRGKCFEMYEQMYNKFSIPVYGFLILNFSVLGIVCAIYSQGVKSTIDRLLESNRNSDAEEQSPGPPRKHKLFIAYSCQLSARILLAILFISLQTQLLYPSNAPSNFNCNLTSDGNQGKNLSVISQNSPQTLHVCNNQRATKKTFWMRAVLAGNVLFALVSFIEIAYISLRARKGRNFTEDAHFVTDYLKLRPRQYVPDHEPEPAIPLREQQDPGQRDQPPAGSENEIPLTEQHEPEELQEMKKNILDDTERLSDLKSIFPNNPGEGENKLLTLDKIYTNLVIHDGRAKYDFTGDRKKQLQAYPGPGGKKQHPKSAEDVVDARQQKILIVGRPGIGKTLFSIKFLRDWASEKVFSKTHNSTMYFNVAFLVKFRKFNWKEELNLRKLLSLSEYSHTDHLDDEIWKYILDNPEKVLLIFDGIDEFKHNVDIAEANTNTDFKNNSETKMPLSFLYEKLASGKLLRGATILTTTRPTAVSTVRYLQFDKTVEIVGFSSEQVKEYVFKFTGEDKMAGEKLWQHISSNMNLFSFSYIPVNCFIICSCLLEVLKFHAAPNSTSVSLPTKVTEIYIKVAKLFFYRHNEEFRDKIVTREDFESDDLPAEVEEKFKQLGKIAFNGIREGSLIFGGSEVHGLQDSALFHRLPDRQTGPFKHEEQFCFLHLTLQEFFAARHITDTMNETELKNFVADHIEEGKWQLVLQFVAGLIGDGNKLWSELFTQLLPEETWDYGDISWPTLGKLDLAVTLAKCSYESSKLDSFVKSKLQHINFNMVYFNGCGLTAVDCTALVHVLRDVPQISRLDLTDNNIGPLGCAEIGKWLVNKNSQLRRLHLPVNHISGEGVKHLAEALSSQQCKLTELYLCNNSISDEGVRHLVEALRSQQCKLTVLDLSKNSITDEGVRHLVEALSSQQCKLTKLYLGYNSISDEGVRHLVEALSSQQCKLTVLDLSYNSISDEGVRHLVEALSSQQCKLTELDLSENSISDERVRHLVEALSSQQCKLTLLYLHSNSITDEGVRHLVKALSSQHCKLTVLYLSYNSISDEGVRHLVEALSSQHCKLTELYLRNNSISDEGVRHLVEALSSQQCKLTVLDLILNKLTNTGKQHLRKAVEKSRPSCQLLL